MKITYDDNSENIINDLNIYQHNMSLNHNIINNQK